MLGGCIKKPTPRGHVESMNFDENFSLVYQMSKQCFEKDYGLFSDGVLVKAQKNHQTGKITFHRFSIDIGLTEPFITLNFANNQIEVTEGTYECSYNGCVEFNIKNEIEHWLSGSKTCIYQKY